MTDYPMLDDKLATLRHAIEGGVKADTMQAMKLCELVDAIGEQFKREIAEAEGEPFQDRVRPWMMACFGAEISADRIERNHRFFEEATELVQANGMTRSEAHQLVDYTFDRPVGELHQEVGGVMVTLAALCLASGADMHAAAETELARIWTKVETIRAKQAAKPKRSPLPEAAPPAASGQKLTSDDADMVWPKHDTEQFNSSIDEAVDTAFHQDGLVAGQILTFDVAKRLPDVKVRILSVSVDEDRESIEWEIVDASDSATASDSAEGGVA